MWECSWYACIFIISSLLVFVLIFSYAMVISFGVSSYLYVAFFYCEVDGSSLCLQCDMLVHVGGKRTHGRYLLLRQRVEVCELPKHQNFIMFSPYAPNLSFIWDVLSSFLGIKLVARMSWDCSMLILEVIEGNLIISYLILHQKKIRTSKIQFQCHKRISMGKKWKVS